MHSERERERDARVNSQAVQSKAELLTTAGNTDEKDLTTDQFSSTKSLLGVTMYLQGHAETCVERYCEMAAKTTFSLQLVAATPWVDDHSLPPEDFQSKGEVSDVCAQIVLKALSLARIGRPDLLWVSQQVSRVSRQVVRSL